MPYTRSRSVRLRVILLQPSASRKSPGHSTEIPISDRKWQALRSDGSAHFPKTTAPKRANRRSQENVEARHHRGPKRPESEGPQTSKTSRIPAPFQDVPDS